MEYYDFELKVEGIDDIVEKFAIQKVSLLRRFCIIMGIQVSFYNNSNSCIFAKLTRPGDNERTLLFFSQAATRAWGFTYTVPFYC